MDVGWGKLKGMNDSGFVIYPNMTFVTIGRFIATLGKCRVCITIAPGGRLGLLQGRVYYCTFTYEQTLMGLQSFLEFTPNI